MQTVTHPAEHLLVRESALRGDVVVRQIAGDSDRQDFALIERQRRNGSHCVCDCTGSVRFTFSQLISHADLRFSKPDAL